MSALEAASASSTASPAGVRARANQISVVIACLIGNIVSPTPIVYGALSIYLVPISRDFAWPREAVSGVLTVLALMTASAYPFVGRIADRFGSRRPILFGILAFGACITALGFSNGGVAAFYGLFALIGAVGSLPSSMMYARVVAAWFDKGRGAMLGVTGRPRQRRGRGDHAVRGAWPDERLRLARRLHGPGRHRHPDRLSGDLLRHEGAGGHRGRERRAGPAGPGSGWGGRAPPASGSRSAPSASAPAA